MASQAHALVLSSTEAGSQVAMQLWSRKSIILQKMKISPLKDLIIFKCKIKYP